MDLSNFKEFHCSICDKLFDGFERCPKMLSCGHSFCLSCLNKIFPHSPCCPTCKTDIHFASVDLIPVNLLIKSCVSKINATSGVKRKDGTELKGVLKHSTAIDAKRQKLVSVGFCDEHGNSNQLRCMNCESWICSMCATLSHKKCETLLIDDAFKEIQKKNTEIIAKQRDIRKSKLTIVFKSQKAVEDVMKSLEQDVENLKLKIEAKLEEINNQKIEFDKLQAIIDDEKNVCAKLNEIQQQSNSSPCIEKLLETKKELDTLIEQAKSDQEFFCSIVGKIQLDETDYIKGQTIELNEDSSDLEQYLFQSDEMEIDPESEDKPLIENNKGTSGDKAGSDCAGNPWNRGRVLLVGDSRVKRLMQLHPHPILSKNVDWTAKNDALFDEIVTFVDEKLSHSHSVLIIMGFIGDKTELCSYPTSTNKSVSLMTSRDCNPTSAIITGIKEAHERWIEKFPNLIIIWTLPYYLDLVSFNRNNLLEVDDKSSREKLNDYCLQASKKFVEFLNSMKVQWKQKLYPKIQYKPLNEVLFHGSQRQHLASFAFSSAKYFRFPPGRLCDGFHPSEIMSKNVWHFLENASKFEERRFRGISNGYENGSSSSNSLRSKLGMASSALKTQSISMIGPMNPEDWQRPNLRTIQTLETSVAGNYSIPPPVSYSIPPPVSYSIPQPVSYSIPPPVSYSIPPPVSYSIPQPVSYSIPPPVRPQTFAELMPIPMHQAFAGNARPIPIHQSARPQALAEYTRPIPLHQPVKQSVSGNTTTNTFPVHSPVKLETTAGDNGAITNQSGGERPILIIGDSRVGEIMKYPKQVFEANVEFYWEKEMKVSKMIKAVDEMIRKDHSAIILVGLLTDFTELKTVTSSNGESTEKLVCEAGEDEIGEVMEKVIEASRRWERDHIGQVIVWTIPYFLDFSRFNYLKIGDECVIQESKEYTSNLIKIFNMLKETWKNLLVGIPYSDLNDALFHHCSAKSKLWKTISSTHAIPENHPFLMLTTKDGIHPSERLVTHMWTKFSRYVDLRSRYLEKAE